MKRSEAINNLRQDLPRIIWRADKSRGRFPGYVCPLCGSGSGKNGTGLTTKDGVHFMCWAGCTESAPQDVFYFIGKEYGLNDFVEQFKKACELYGINYNALEADNGGAFKSTAAVSAKKEPIKELAEEPETDYMDFFVEAAKHATETDYLQKRGISEELVRRYNIGYCASWTHPKAPNAPKSPRIIIPTSPTSYLSRDTRTDLTDQQKKYAKTKVGRMHIFNINVLLQEVKTVFITEGEIDALSFMEVGFNAIGLGSVNMANSLVSFLKEHKTNALLLIALDTDAAGTEAAKSLHAKLSNIGVSSYIVNPADGYKDANEALIADKEAFKAKCKAARDSVKAEILEAENKARNAYISAHSVLSNRKAYEAEIEANISLPTTSTGYCGLDSILNGGLQKGLYFIGGISSIGKTTFCMQIADNIAKAGEDVLIFALEMATNELIAKSVSRYTYFKDLELYNDTRHAKSTAAVLNDKNKANYTSEERHVLEGATDAYFDEIAPHLFIHEGVGNIGVEEIKTAVKEHISITGNKPIVFIDYLQILAPNDIKATDKQNTDKAVLELKRLSRDEGIPVLAISSFNRESYTQSVTMASFKESGAVEYTSDVLMGLQFAGMDRLSAETEKDYNERVRKTRETEEENGRTGKPQHLQIKILKNRNGKKGSAELSFLPAFNYFYENGSEADKNPFRG